MANSIDVSAIRSAALQTSNEWSGLARSFLSTMEALVNTDIDVRLPSIGNLSPGTGVHSIMLSTAQNRPEVDGETTFSTPGSDPGDFSSGVVLTPPNLVQMPGYNLASPSISLPTRPTLVVPDAPGEPTLESVEVPVAPTIELPQAPTLASVTFPDAPTLALPSFSEAAPDLPTSFALTANFTYQDEEPPTQILGEVEDKLSFDLANGGYGIEATDEHALWARARDRNMRELSAVETETSERYASRGYNLPPGAYLAALTQARSDADEKLAETGREIMVKRADLFRENRQFAISQGISVGNTRMQHYGFAMERALNAQRFAAEYAIAVHDGYIRQFNAELQRYTAIADVYRTRLQGTLAQVQIYEAEIRAAVARQQANQVDVELYRALISAATSRVQLFEAQLRGASLVVEMQRMKVDTYRAQVQAFATRIEANESQLKTYEAGIRGEIAKVDIFRAEVGAYSDRVRAAGIEQGALNERAQVLIAQRSSEVAQYRSAIERHQLNISAESARVASILEKYNADSRVYSAALSGLEAVGRLELGQDDAQIRVIQENTRRHQANAQMEIEQITASLNARFSAANAGSQLTTGIVTAVNNTFQALAVEQTTTEEAA